MTDIPIMISTYAKHDDDGTLIEKHENWSNLSGPPRSMYTTTPFEQYDYEYDNEGNLITTIKVMESGDCYWECEDVAVLIREEVAVTSPQGALLSKNIETFTQEFDPYDYGNFVKILNNPIDDIGYHAGGGGAIDTDYYYEDEDFPLKPTRIIEHFDDDGDGQYDRPSKKTTLKYDDDGRGNVEEMRVYVDDVNFVYTKYDYHQDYDFPIKETTYQAYCYDDDDGEAVTTEAEEVGRRWLYGTANGTLIEGGTQGDYLVKESILIDDDPLEAWADTLCTYSSAGGRIESMTDPEGSITFYKYDDNGYPSKEWQGLASSPPPSAVDPSALFCFCHWRNPKAVTHKTARPVRCCCVGFCLVCLLGSVLGSKGIQRRFSIELSHFHLTARPGCGDGEKKTILERKKYNSKIIDETSG